MAELLGLGSKNRGKKQNVGPQNHNFCFVKATFQPLQHGPLPGPSLASFWAPFWTHLGSQYGLI